MNWFASPPSTHTNIYVYLQFCRTCMHPFLLLSVWELSFLEVYFSIILFMPVGVSTLHHHEVDLVMWQFSRYWFWPYLFITVRSSYVYWASVPRISTPANYANSFGNIIDSFFLLYYVKFCSLLWIWLTSISFSRWHERKFVVMGINIGRHIHTKL